ncbi:MAG: hypothetical protein ACRDJU_02055 [Actinomycetota bacterium]
MDGVEAKIRRAQTHLDDFKTRFEDTLKKHSQTFPIEPDVQPDYHIMRLYGVPAIDPEWSLIVGDCIHNIRSALDHLAWRLVELDGGTPAERTQFPIKEAPVKGRGSSILGAPIDPPIHRGDIRKLIEEVQPYNIGNRPGSSGATYRDDSLWRINKLDNIDKHRLMLLLATIPELNELEWARHPDIVSLELPFEALVDGAEVARFQFRNGQLPADYDPHPTIQIALNERVTAPHFLTYHLPWALGNLIVYVDHIVLGDKRLCSGFRQFFP